MDGGATEQWKGLLRDMLGAQWSWEKVELQVLEWPMKAACPPSLPAVGKLEAALGQRHTLCFLSPHGKVHWWRVRWVSTVVGVLSLMRDPE